MGVEQSDMYIILKPRDDWRRGLTKAALAQEVSEIVRGGPGRRRRLTADPDANQRADRRRAL